MLTEQWDAEGSSCTLHTVPGRNIASYRNRPAVLSSICRKGDPCTAVHWRAGIAMSALVASLLLLLLLLPFVAVALGVVAIVVAEAGRLRSAAPASRSLSAP